MNPAIATVIGALAGGAVAIIVAIINTTAGRGGRRADIADKVSAAWDPVFDRMDKDLERVSKQCEKCENRLAATQRALAEMETEFRRTKATLRALIRVLDENDPTQIASAVAAARELTVRCGAVIDPVGDGDEADWHECDKEFNHDSDHECHCGTSWSRLDPQSVSPHDEYRGQ